MFKQISIWLIDFNIAWRYVTARHRINQNSEIGSRDGFLSFISLISIVGIILGVAVLITVLSVMNGFQKEVKNKMLSVLSHVEIYSKQHSLQNSNEVIKYLQSEKHIIGIAPIITSQAIILHKGKARGVMFRGVDPQFESNVSDIEQNFIQGNISMLQANKFSLALGCELAKILEASIGDQIMVILPSEDNLLIPKINTFQLIGIINSGHYEFDNSLVLVNYKDAEELLKLNGFSGFRIKLDNIEIAPYISDKLIKKLPNLWLVQNWTDQNKNWFAAVQIEKRMMFLILSMIIAIATFNLVSTLVMIVTNKKSDIAVLRIIGASTGAIQRIFLFQGLIIGFLGTIGGILLGVLISLNIETVFSFVETHFNLKLIPQDIYFISSLPSEIHNQDIINVGFMSFSLSILATLYPSWRAARMNPIHALRFE